MNCTNCGNPIGEGFKFCMKCGTPVGAPAAAPASAPAPGPAASSTAPVYAPVAPATGTPKQMEDPNYIPYCPPSLVGGNVIVPPGRPYRLRCPDCGCLSNATKTDSTPGYACTNCGKAYAYGGQLLLYRMGSFHPMIMALPYHVIIDNMDYGELKNHSSVRIMLSSGAHTVSVGYLGGKHSNQYQINITPEYFNFAFKFNIVYKPFGRPGGSGFPTEFKQCAPEEIPYI